MINLGSIARKQTQQHRSLFVVTPHSLACYLHFEAKIIIYYGKINHNTNLSHALAAKIQITSDVDRVQTTIKMTVSAAELDSSPIPGSSVQRAVIENLKHDAAAIV